MLVSVGSGVWDGVAVIVFVGVAVVVAVCVAVSVAVAVAVVVAVAVCVAVDVRVAVCVAVGLKPTGVLVANITGRGVFVAKTACATTAGLVVDDCAPALEVAVVVGDAGGTVRDGATVAVGSAVGVIDGAKVLLADGVADGIIACAMVVAVPTKIGRRAS